MKIHSLATATLLLTLSVSAETFRLENLFSDQKTGPLNFKHGTLIPLGDADYQLLRIDPNHNEILQQIKDTMIDELVMNMETSGKELSIWLTETLRKQCNKDFPSIVSINQQRKDESVRLSVENFSSYEFLNVLAEMINARLSIRHEVIMFEPAPNIPVPQYTRDRSNDFSIFDPESNTFIEVAGFDEAAPSPSRKTFPEKMAPLEKTANELFSLKHRKTGNTFGPFQLKNAEVIKLEGETYVIKQDSKEAELITSMKAVTLSRFVLKEETLQSTLKKLEKSAPANIKLRLSDEFSDSTERTCDLSGISLYNAVAIICEISGLEWAFENGDIVFSKSPLPPPKEPQPTPTQETYRQDSIFAPPKVGAVTNIITPPKGGAVTNIFNESFTR